MTFLYRAIFFDVNAQHRKTVVCFLVFTLLVVTKGVDEIFKSKGFTIQVFKILFFYVTVKLFFYIYKKVKNSMNRNDPVFPHVQLSH